ncbi:MAG TPA: hypothetical protein VKT75_05810 [Acidobacteriaceae bacterium]|nr:hypothetical protein [Acidobacteriaceae bacterium]
MSKWRYHSILMRDLSIADAKLNAEGERGWELVSVCLVDANTARAYFKQPTEEVTEAVVQAEPALVTQNPF